MKYLVTMLIDVSPETNEREVQYTLMDALAEFQSARFHNGEAYVERRYPDTKDYAWLNREDKIKQVNRRIKLAETMRMSITVSEDI